jgi:hypothetical protein
MDPSRHLSLKIVVDEIRRDGPPPSSRHVLKPVGRLIPVAGLRRKEEAKRQRAIRALSFQFRYIKGRSCRMERECIFEAGAALRIIPWQKGRTALRRCGPVVTFGSARRDDRVPSRLPRSPCRGRCYRDLEVPHPFAGAPCACVRAQRSDTTGRGSSGAPL